ncbi:MAG: DUF6798 domain-containing protein [Cytophagales bacterium]
MLKIRRSDILDISFSLLLTVAFIFLKGYTFNNGDQADHLLPVYEKIANGTFKGDFFMDYQAQSFSIRQAYIWLLFGLNFIAPLALWSFVLTFLCIFSAIFGWSKLAFHLTKNEFAAFISPILIFFVFYGFTVGGCNLMYSIFITSTIAKAFVPWAILYFLGNKYVVSGIIVGIATIFHAIVGLQIFIILGLIMIFNRRETGWKSILLYFSIYFSLASFVIVPNIQLQFFNDFVYDKSLYNQIFYHFRNPHHYLPRSFPLIQWLKYLFIIAIIVFTAFFKDKRAKYRSVFLFFGIQTFGLLVYSVMTEGFDIYKFNAIQWFKSTIWVAAFACIFLGEWLSAFGFFKNIWVKFAWLVQNWKLNLAVSFFGLVFMLNANLIPIEKFKSRYQVGNYKKTELQTAHDWIRLHTPKQSLFVAPPSDFGFGCETLRPSLVNCKALVHEPKYMLQWYERISAIYKTTFEDLQGKSFVEAAEMKYKLGDFDSKKFKAEYGLLYKPLKKAYPVLYQTEMYVVVKF